jgi:predicted ribosome quality control (RQC) complex YloA/Tae2 family protein
MAMLPDGPNEGAQPYRHFVIDEWNVYIGKNDRQNDELSCSFCRPWDIWMHVAAQAGSHVVIQRDKNADWPPHDTLEKAAALTAWFSKARNARSVKVHVTEGRFVRKSKKAPRGEVQLGNYKTLRVSPASPRLFRPDKYDK